MAVRVLFVCLGNICRSPAAEGVFRHLVEQEGLAGEIEIDSAGTASYHVGESPDQRSQASALRRGIDMSHQRARQTKPSDFETFDYVLAMDEDNLRNLQAICPDPKTHNPGLFLSFAPQAGRMDVPDPYYGGPNGFEIVLDLIEDASKGLLKDIKEHHPL
ncbi:MAG: low molecular weight phosphotyrosine protein phosphatase [Rhodospirillales bacterium]|nr:low molecular weight phosphotyrosine protein phosphatase [Rhodospirillales bacterium]